jgi:hypothetical protein
MAKPSRITPSIDISKGEKARLRTPLAVMGCMPR